MVQFSHNGLSKLGLVFSSIQAISQHDMKNKTWAQRERTHQEQRLDWGPACIVQIRNQLCKTLSQRRGKHNNTQHKEGKSPWSDLRMIFNKYFLKCISLSLFFICFNIYCICIEFPLPHRGNTECRWPYQFAGCKLLIRQYKIHWFITYYDDSMLESQSWLI